MAKTQHIWNTDKKGGVALTSKIVQSGSADFPLLYAKDLDWGNVNIDSTTYINTTDELLDYISGVSQKAEREQLSITAYTIYDEKTKASYETVLYNNYEKITLVITRSINGTASSITIGEVDTTGTKYLLLDFNGDIISDVYLSDPDKILNASKEIPTGLTAGIKTISILSRQNDTVIATFSLVIIPQAYKMKGYTLYAHTTNTAAPSAPSGTKYKNNVLTTPTGWYTFENASWINDETKVIWTSNVTLSGNDQEMTQSYATDPVRMFRLCDVKNDVRETTSFPVAIYRAKKASATQSWTSVAPTGGSYNYTNNTFTCPSGWYKSVSEAMSAYSNTDSDCEIYVSYNNYVAYKDKDAATYTASHQTGWTVPNKYIDIDGILKAAKNEAKQAAESAISTSLSDLQNAIELLDTSSEQCAAIISQLNSDYSWTLLSSSTINNSKYTEITSSDPNYSKFNPVDGRIEIVDESVFNNNEALTSEEFQNKYVKVAKFGTGSGTKTNVYVGYVPSSMNLVTQLAAMDEKVSTLNTTVNEMTPEKIRLQASAGFMDKVTWTAIKSDLWNTIPASKKHEVSSLPTSNYQYGDYYRVGSAYYRCDYPISTGFIDILASKISLGVARNDSGNTLSSTITLSVDGKSSAAQIAADQIVLNGDTIAEAIKAKELNVANKCYIKTNGEVLLAQGTSGASAFKTNGDVSLAGGRIQYTATANTLEVTGKIKAESGEIGKGDSKWYIGAQYLYGTDGNANTLVLSPSYIASADYNSGSYRWYLDRDGSAMFANNLVKFDANGEGRIGTEDSNIAITKNGISLNGAKGSITLSDDSITTISTDETIINSLNTAVTGTLNTKDLSIGGTSRFNQDGSGWIAKRNIEWDKNGEMTMTGNISAKSFSTLNASGKVAMKFTTVGESGATASELNNAGLSGANSSTPVIVVYDYSGSTVAKYLVNLTKLGGASGTNTTPYLKQLFIGDDVVSFSTADKMIGNNEIYITSYQSGSAPTYSPVGTSFYKIVNESCPVIVPTVNNYNYYAQVSAKRIVKYTVNEKSVDKSYAYYCPAPRFYSNEGMGGVNRQDGWYLISPTGDDVEYKTDAGKYISVSSESSIQFKTTSNARIIKDDQLKQMNSVAFSQIKFISKSGDLKYTENGQHYTADNV